MSSSKHLNVWKESMTATHLLHHASPTSFSCNLGILQFLEWNHHLSHQIQKNPQKESSYPWLHFIASTEEDDTLLDLKDKLKKENINERDHNGNTPLMWAALFGNEKMVRILLENGASLNLQNDKGETALFLSLSNQHYSITLYLMDHGADVNIPNLEELTPLHVAVVMGNCEIVQNLIKRGAYVNSKDDSGDTALHFAVREGNYSLVELLVKEYNAEMTLFNEDNESPLDLADCLHEKEISTYLIHSLHQKNL